MHRGRVTRHPELGKLSSCRNTPRPGYYGLNAKGNFEFDRTVGYRKKYGKGQ
jgi:hypothetical protein